MTPKHITECIPPALKKKGRAVSLAAPGVPGLGACAPSSPSVCHLVDANELQLFCYRLVYDVAPVSSSCPQFAGLSADMSDGLAALRVLFCFAKKILGCGIGLVRHIDIRALEAFCSSFSIADASVLSDLDLPDFRLDDGSATLRVLARFAPQCRIAVAAPALAALAPATPYAPEFRAFCGSLVSRDVRGLAGPALFAVLEDQLAALAALRVLDLFEQRGGVAHG